MSGQDYIIPLKPLVRVGYIERPERGVYTITEKGRRFLEAIPQDS